MECKDSNINDINPNQINNIEEIIFPIIKNKNFIDQFDSFIFGYLLGNLIKDQNQNKSINEELIENIYEEYQKQNKLPFVKIYQNLNLFLSNNINNNTNQIKNNINLNIAEEDSDNFNLLDFENTNDTNDLNQKNNNCNFIDINSIDNFESYQQNNNINNNNININSINKKESIIGPEDYEDYELEEENKTGKCLICLEDYEIALPENYYLDCGCIIHASCFDDYIENAINSGKVPIKCPYCNKEDINEIDIKDSLNKNNKINLIEKFDKFIMNYYIMQHPEDISCCPTAGCNYIFVYEDGDDYFECPLCKNEYCLKCKIKWHEGKTCEEYKEMKKMEILGKDESKLDDLFYNFAKGSKFKQCPYCRNWVEKTDGCNHIACRCGNHFCYFCGEGMNGNINGHFCKVDQWNYHYEPNRNKKIKKKNINYEYRRGKKRKKK